MLWRVLQSNNGLPSEAKVCFANTGKEEEATLRFVQDCSEKWCVPITWVEYQWAEETKDRFKVVDFATASRDGEPFEEMVLHKQYLPNPVARFCTIELKIRTMANYLYSIGFCATRSDGENMAWVGIRADEMRRAAKIDRDRTPLVTAGVTKEMVGEFWRKQPFDLGLPNMNGVTMHGNCDLCYLKGASQILSLIAEKPERAVWWARMESVALNSAITGARFRSDRPSYTEMLKFTKEQRDLFAGDTETIPCFCGD